MTSGQQVPTLWTEFMHSYIRDARLLDEGLTTPQEKRQFEWLADYAFCAWGPGGRGTLQDPYWLWPGAVRVAGNDQRSMSLAEVRRPGETMQFADGFTGLATTAIRRQHQNGQLNGAFLDGHARLVTEAEWTGLGRDELGYF